MRSPVTVHKDETHWIINGDCGMPWFNRLRIRHTDDRPLSESEYVINALCETIEALNLTLDQKVNRWSMKWRPFK